MKPEEWRTIPGFSKYKASTYGRIAGKRTKRILKQNKERDGYLKISIIDDYQQKRTKQVHRLILITFKGPPPFPGCLTRHYPDSNKTNNHIDNLHWGTSQENRIDYLKQNDNDMLLTETQVIDIKNRMLSGEKNIDLIKDYNTNDSTLSSIRTGKSYSYFGPDISHLPIISEKRKLTDDEIREIRTSNLSHIAEGKKRGVHHSTISRIRSYITYKDVI